MEHPILFTKWFVTQCSIKIFVPLVLYLQTFVFFELYYLNILYIKIIEHKQILFLNFYYKQYALLDYIDLIDVETINVKLCWHIYIYLVPADKKREA